MRALPTLLPLLLLLAPAAADTYTLVPDSCEVVALLKPAGIAARLAHEHVIHAQSLQGSFTLTDDPAGCAVAITVAATELEPDEGAMREKYGLEDDVSDDDRDEIRENMHGEDQLATEDFPEISFRSKSFTKTDEGWDITGTFTLRGVEKELTVSARIDAGSGALRCETSFTLLQSDFGYSPYSAMFGAIRNADEVEVRVKLFGLRE